MLLLQSAADRGLAQAIGSWILGMILFVVVALLLRCMVLWYWKIHAIEQLLVRATALLESIDGRLAGKNDSVFPAKTDSERPGAGSSSLTLPPPEKGSNQALRILLAVAAIGGLGFLLLWFIAR